MTDASIIAAKSDGVILIVHTAKTLKSELIGARASIESVNGKLFGAVLNKIPPNSAGDYSYRYGYRSYFGLQYTSEQGLVYAPSEDEIKRIEREEFFDRLTK